MNFKKDRKSDIFALFLIFFGIVSRIFPHPPNFTPVTAIGLFANSRLSKYSSLWLPLIIMFISDAIIGFHSLILFTYGSFMLTSLISYFYLRNNLNFKKIIAATLFSSILFFIITNFGVWLEGKLYTKDLQGLVSCFVNAIPFFRNTLLGDLIYTGVFFGMYEMAVKNQNKFVSKTESI